jgi:hypothetical protein
VLESVISTNSNNTDKAANADGWLGASVSSNNDIAVSLGSLHYSSSTSGGQDPTKPSMVLFGLTAGAILVLPKRFPEKYAPVSAAHTRKQTNNTSFAPWYGFST